MVGQKYFWGGKNKINNSEKSEGKIAARGGGLSPPGLPLVAGCSLPLSALDPPDCRRFFIDSPLRQHFLKDGVILILILLQALASFPLVHIIYAIFYDLCFH